MSSASDASEATKRFGELAVENGFATSDEVELALEAQKKGEPGDLAQASRLGQILLDMGTLTPEQVEAVILAQARLKRAQSESVLNCETDTKILPAKSFTQTAQSLAAEPSGWLILETEGRSATAYPMWDKVMLGRSPTHEVPVPDMLSSRDHARIEFLDGRHVLTDLSSRNGTFVNEEKAESPRPLEPGDRIRIGSIIFRYAPGTRMRSTSASEASAPEDSEGGRVEEPTSFSSPSVAEEPAAAEPEPPAEEHTDVSSPAVTEEPAAPDPEPAVSADESSTTITPITGVTPPEEPDEPGEEKKPEAPAPAIKPQLEEAKKVAKIAGGGALKALRAFDGLVAKVLPRIHNQRKYVTAGSALGILAVFTPWFEYQTELGIATGTGWLTLLMFAVTIFLVLYKAGPGPVEFRLLMAVIPLPLLAGVFALLDPMPAASTKVGFGIWVTILVGLGTAAIAFFTRGDVAPPPEDAPLVSSAAPPPPAEGTEQKGFKGLAGSFLDKTKRLARDVSGKRAKEKAQAVERRDALLAEIAEAAARANLDAPETQAVTKAAEAVKALEGKEGGADAKATVQQKQKTKSAEGKLQRARLKLARAVIDRGLAVDGIQEKIDEVKALDAQVKDLS